MTETNNDSQNEELMIDDLELENNARSDEDGNITINKAKFAIIKKLLINIREDNEKLLELISGIPLADEDLGLGDRPPEDNLYTSESEEEMSEAGRIIEGVFDGENMIGPDGKQYSVPANYASKSKLIEGDILKLTITATGTFVYKQIGPIERRRLVGVLEQGSGGDYYVNTDNKKLKVLTASVTYFKGQAGDEVVVLVPKTGTCNWAAVDNIVRNG